MYYVCKNDKCEFHLAFQYRTICIYFITTGERIFHSQVQTIKGKTNIWFLQRSIFILQNFSREKNKAKHYSGGNRVIYLNGLYYNTKLYTYGMVWRLRWHITSFYLQYISEINKLYWVRIGLKVTFTLTFPILEIESRSQMHHFYYTSF